MTVYMLGAGPGDPELITLKAINILKKAEVVLYDSLANDELLEYAPDDAKLIFVGKRAGEHYRKQPEINQLLIEEGKQHDIVVRLKGGDPFIFGRGGEEELALLEEGIDVQVVPGINSALGSSAMIGLPLTHRAVSTSLTLITGHEDPEKSEKQVNWDYTADTLVVFMGVGLLKKYVPKILEYRSPETPVCVIENGTLPEQRVITGTLGDIVEKKINPPALVIIGEVVNIYLESQKLRSKLE
ncbi:MAG: uroporphyrinogen-III C-methyltransferase [Methanosphaera sp.]|uniref:uroporphyrinogen-III C-methyltransferase n=1 Tax=Methanosphaera sp. TaxID=2666342 RepID=UPI0025D3A9D5|nr:uroporphyrinogen-III C-methyltransferase [Methanosphaera sp.]MCI5867304.1 uroporphyrinogen-III C-methyltransferase [Methanosphaera sp.]MDD6534628.1 uroporphyrinogen-III C-methyltransferase [Methanosphaera sp.]MDY3955704.1 uroporphyrinogen-III C-methyltransferase [Methanosphaera sp.]